jgi:hypothetical protein
LNGDTFLPESIPKNYISVIGHNSMISDINQDYLNDSSDMINEVNDEVNDIMFAYSDKNDKSGKYQLHRLSHSNDVIAEINDKRGCLVFTDVNRCYNQAANNECNKFVFLEIQKINSKQLKMTQHKVNFYNNNYENVLAAVCNTEFINIFRDKILSLLIEKEYKKKEYKKEGQTKKLR